MNRKIERLRNIISEIDSLIEQGVTSSDVSFLTWENKANNFLLSMYNKEDYQYRKFDNIAFSQMDFSIINGRGPTINQKAVCKRGLLIAKGQLQNILETLEDKEETCVSQTPTTSKNIVLEYKKVFIVHGHDGELKQSVARIVEKQGIEAIILTEQANQCRTIIEKFETYSDVGGAICLFTADDIGRAKEDATDNTRARQNVVLETGYFMGKLGRDHVVLLADKGIEIPSDLSGVVYTNTTSWQVDLLKELNAIGYTIDLNKLL